MRHDNKTVIYLVKRTPILAAAATLAALMAAPQAMAIACNSETLVDGTPAITCTQAGSTAFTDNRDNLQVTIDNGASLLSNTRDQSPLNLGGNNQIVNNLGLIENTDARNNTDAISVRGTDLNVINNGVIRSGDRGIQVLGGNGDLTVENHGEISSRRQAIRALEAMPGSKVINDGVIESQNGRALQLRGDGSSVINRGTLIGGEEVVEGRGNFNLENHGEILLRDGVADEDGVQFASGRVDNWGIIRGSDDGVDIDQGLIHNHGTGRIISTGPDNIRDHGGIDVDAEFDNGVDPVVPAGKLTIINEGLIEGPRAIVTDSASQASIEIINSGTLRGRSGIAIDLAPDQGDSSLKLKGGSEIFGDVLFGAGNDNVIIDGLTSGSLSDGIFDGGLGVDMVSFASYLLEDLSSFLLDGNLVTLVLQSTSGNATGLFRNFESWKFQDGSVFGTTELSQLFQLQNTVPTPATLPLLLSALGIMWVVRRRQ